MNVPLILSFDKFENKMPIGAGFPFHVKIVSVGKSGEKSVFRKTNREPKIKVGKTTKITQKFLRRDARERILDDIENLTDLKILREGVNHTVLAARSGGTKVKREVT